jgi:proline racemase
VRWSRMVTLVGAHAEGEIGRVVTGGVVDPAGATMAEKLVSLRDDAPLRRFLVGEPRGAAQMSTNLLVAPTRPGADAGFLILQPDGVHAMSGSNAICVTTVLLETGMVPMREPVSDVVLDTAAGLVRARAECVNGRCAQVSLDMPPSFAWDLDHPLEVEGLGRVAVDVAYGGAFYVLTDAAALGVRIGTREARRLVDLGDRIKRAALDQLEVVHPEIPALNRIEYVMFCAEEGDMLRNATVIHPGRIDRSPCGTGSAARLAVMQARGRVSPGDRLTFRSIVDSRFDAEVLGIGVVGDRHAIRSRIAGRAWIYSHEQLGLDPSDPWPGGFTLGDTWGPAAC